MKRALLMLTVVALAGAAAPERPKFRWPLIGKVAKSDDGGVDIAIRAGEPVHAAGDGVVIYASDEIAAYGKMIVVRHSGEYVTTYAHLSEMNVAKDARVRRGQIIGKSGQTGDAKTPGLHFELREGETSVDPVEYLTPR